MSELKIQRAVDEIAKVAGGRRYVIVYEVTHPKAQVTGVRVRGAEEMTFWEMRGLLGEARRRLNRDERKLRHRG